MIEPQEGEVEEMIGSKEIHRTIEVAMDGLGVSRVLEIMMLLCELKAEHLIANWQDKEGARAWKRRRKELQLCRTKMRRLE